MRPTRTASFAFAALLPMALFGSPAVHAARDQARALLPVSWQAPRGLLVAAEAAVETTVWAGHSVEQAGGPSELVSAEAQQRMLRPAREALSQLGSSHWLQELGIDPDTAVAVIAVERGPRHGKLEQLPGGTFRYTPRASYVGNDVVSFLVTVQGRRVRVHYALSVVRLIEEPKA